MQTIARWESVAKSHLKDRTIVDMFYLNKKEVEDMAWYRSGLVLVLDNGAQVVVQQDDEGNGPGALLVSTSTDSIILPTI
jgi:hypothetical protein